MHPLYKSSGSSTISVLDVILFTIFLHIQAIVNIQDSVKVSCHLLHIRCIIFKLSRIARHQQQTCMEGFITSQMLQPFGIGKQPATILYGLKL